MIENKNNSTIFKNPYEDVLRDLSFVGSYKAVNTMMEFEQPTHAFTVGDVIYYDVKMQKFAKALAINDLESEVCGVVSEVINTEKFRAINHGLLETDRYTFDVGTVLYLSESTPGKLMSIAPVAVVKQVATQAANGIIIDIQRGYQLSESGPVLEELESYTQAELDEIIKNIW